MAESFSRHHRHRRNRRLRRRGPIRAARGLRTAVIERDDVVGGRCLNYACIPAKAVLRSADILTEVREAGEYGILLNGTEPTVDFGAIGERRKKVISTLTGGVVKSFNI